ncbi:MAG TPA: ATP-binding protein [Myxococcales bacterium]|nr:ATP-binding protein [Myxococcales bacterium]
MKEEGRLKALRATGLLDSLPENDFDEIVQLASLICGTPMALISLVDEDRQWFKSRVGLEATQTPRDVAFCAHAIEQPDRMFVVEDAFEDPRFAKNPLVTSSPNIRFYAGAPLVTREGEALGTLCVLDRVPRRLSASQVRALDGLKHQVQAQIELRRHAKDLRAQEAVIRSQLEELQRLQSLKDDLVSMIVHDLRNPLSAVVGFVDLVHELGRKWLPADLYDYLGKAKQAGLELNERVNGLLEVRLLEHGELRIKPERVSLRELVREAAASIEAETARRNILVEISGDDVVVDVDRKLVRRALENLCSNALKYTEHETRISISLSTEQNGVAVDVADRGLGVPDAYKSSLFEKFGSIEARKGDARRGIGLGLYLVKLVADLHHGEASVMDREGGGAIFRLLLP